MQATSEQFVLLWAPLPAAPSRVPVPRPRIQWLCTVMRLLTRKSACLVWSRLERSTQTKRWCSGEMDRISADSHVYRVMNLPQQHDYTASGASATAHPSLSSSNFSNTLAAAESAHCLAVLSIVSHWSSSESNSATVSASPEPRLNSCPNCTPTHSLLSTR